MRLNVGSLLGRLDFLTGHSWSLAELSGPLKAKIKYRITICPALCVTKGISGI